MYSSRQLICNAIDCVSNHPVLEGAWVNTNNYGVPRLLENTITKILFQNFR